MTWQQSLWQRHISFRFGVDETSETGGVSLRFSPLVIDVAYVVALTDISYDMISSNSVA